MSNQQSNQQILDRLQLFSDIYQAERAVLKDMALFADFYEGETNAFICTAKRRSVPEGHVLLEMGAANESIFLICHGAVEVTRPLDGEELPVATLGVGEAFGEVSYLDDCPAIASVTAAEATTVLELDREAINQIIGDNVQLAAKFWRNLTLVQRERWASIEAFQAQQLAVPQLSLQLPAAGAHA